MGDLLDRLQAWLQGHSERAMTTPIEIVARRLLEEAVEDIKNLRQEADNNNLRARSAADALEALLAVPESLLRDRPKQVLD